MIIYPPFIADTIPGFTSQIDESNISEIEHNFHENMTQFRHFDLPNSWNLIKSIQTGEKNDFGRFSIKIELQNGKIFYGDFYEDNPFSAVKAGQLIKETKKEYWGEGYDRLYQIASPFLKITIPFELNPAVAPKSIKRLSLLIKDYSKEEVIGESIIGANEAQIKSGIAIFNEIICKEGKSLTPTQYYKFQLGFGDEAGFQSSAYSTASIGRYISEAPVSFGVQDLDLNLINSFRESFSTFYTDPTNNDSEPLYSQSLTFTDATGKIIQATGEKIQNTPLKLDLLEELNLGEVYYLKYKIITVNGYEEEKIYSLAKNTAYPTKFYGELKAEQMGVDKDLGRVKIYLSGDNNTANVGTYELLRRNVKETNWCILNQFYIHNNIDLNSYIWYDNTIKQGETYTYAIRKYSSDTPKIYGLKIEIDKPITVDFEDMFLSDNEKTLCIKFNPKVTSFKNTIQETKTDTLDSKYPVFFKNGQLQYKELPISGLISYQMDNAQQFLTDEELGLIEKNRTINLVDYNVAAERIFKLKVLEWLNNGKPKLFRSPAEGNYVVRVMNVSLSPDDKLSRMLHTFSATGYECAAADFNTLKKNNLVQKMAKDNSIWERGELSGGSNNIIRGNLKDIQWSTSTPNTNNTISLDGREFVNITGTFTTPPEQEFLELSSKNAEGTISYGFKIDTQDVYDKESKILEETATISYLSNRGLTCQSIYYIELRKLPGEPSQDNPYDVTIGTMTINVSDGQIRKYYNINMEQNVSPINIAVGEKVQATIYHLPPTTGGGAQ